jgi:predicted transcriptional regulator
MKDRSYASLGEAEMEMLQHVWALGEATVTDVHERVLAEREVAYTTVMSILKKLADKGYLQYRTEGRAYVYSAERPPDEVRSALLQAIIERVFDGSPVALAQTLATQESVSDAEWEEIHALIASMSGLDEDAGGDQA